MSLQKLKESILADGKIDASEVEQIKELIFQDGKIDQEEADFLFELNTSCSDSDNDESWSPLFIDAICNFLLEDENSPGSVDENEAKWLINKIGEDGLIDKTEKMLLKTIQSKAKSVPVFLTEYISKNN